MKNIALVLLSAFLFVGAGPLHADTSVSEDPETQSLDELLSNVKKGRVKPDPCEISDPGTRPLTEEELACIGEPFASLIRSIHNANPVADANREASEGDFRILQITGAWSGAGFPGIICAFDFTDELVRGELFFSDAYYGTGDVIQRAFAHRYVEEFNRTIINHNEYPYKDICRSKKSSDGKDWRGYNSIEEWKSATTTINGDGSLSSAARLGKKKRARSLLAKNVEVDVLDPWGFTPLGWASLRGDEKLVSLLLKNGADPNFHHEKTATILAMAIESGNLEIVTLLLEAGAKLDEESSRMRRTRELGPFEISPLSTAIKVGRPEVVRLFIDYGVDVDGVIGLTPIEYAIRYDRMRILADLLEADARSYGVYANGLSLIQVAAEEKSFRAIDHLMRTGAAADARSEIERKAWNIAHGLQREEILFELIAFGANLNLLGYQEQTSLYEAISDGSLDGVKQHINLANAKSDKLTNAIESGQLIDVMMMLGNGAEISSGRKTTSLIKAVNFQQKNVIDWLLKNGADPDSKIYFDDLSWLNDNDSDRSLQSRRNKVRNKRNLNSSGGPGNTAVSIGFAVGPKPIVESLLEYSESEFSNFPNYYNSPLQDALSGFRNHGNLEIIELALEVGGYPSKSGYESDKFLGEICFRLRKAEAVLTHYLEEGYRPRQRNEKGFPDSRYYGDDLALARCIDQGENETMLLLEYGADPNQSNSIYNSPIMDVLFKMVRSSEGYLGVLERLLKEGGDANTLYYDGNTPLDFTDRRIRRGNRIDTTWSNKEADRFRAARKILRKYGAKTRAELEAEGVLEPREEVPPVIPVL